MARKEQICPTHCKLSKKMSKPVQTHFFFLCIFRVFGQLQELSPSKFEKFIIFLALVQFFRFGRADLPFPGQDRVNRPSVAGDVLQTALSSIINRPGVAGAVLQTALSLINSLINSWFVKISLRRRHAPTVGNGAFSHKIDQITFFLGES